MMPRWAYGALLAGPWIAWLIYWGIRALGNKTVARRESWGSMLAHIVPAVIGGALIVRRPGGPGLAGYYLPREFLLDAYWAGVLLIVAGLGFSVWAREYLGRNWSGTVTLKEDHELVRRGPYAWVRHPIYTGILLAVIGCAVAQGQWRGLIGVALVVLALTLKIRTEERFMGEFFGDAYQVYKKEVPALVPGLF